MKKDVYKVKKTRTFGRAFLGKKAIKEIDLDEEGKFLARKLNPNAPSGKKLIAPSEGYDKPFDYELYNTLRKKGRVERRR